MSSSPRYAPFPLRHRLSAVACVAVALFSLACDTRPPGPVTPTPTAAPIVFATEVPTPTLVRFPFDAPGAGPVTPTLARIAVLTPSPTSASAAVAAASDSPTALVYIANTGGQGATLRQTPSGESMGILPEGTSLTPTGREEQADGRTWKEERGLDGRVGWIAAEFVTINFQAAQPPA